MFQAFLPADVSIRTSSVIRSGLRISHQGAIRQDNLVQAPHHLARLALPDIDGDNIPDLQCRSASANQFRSRRAAHLRGPMLRGALVVFIVDDD